MTVFLNGVADLIPKTLLTTTGDLIDASAPSTPARLAAGAVGTVLTGQGAGVVPAFAAAATGALTYAGGNTTEATTTSTSVVDLLSATVSIAAAKPLLAVVALRKTAGAAAYASSGWKVNTVIASGDGYWSSSTNQIEQGGTTITIFGRVTGYLRPGWMMRGGAEGGTTTWWSLFTAADMPTDTVTAVVLRAKVGDALVTMGADELQVYAYANS